MKPIVPMGCLAGLALSACATMPTPANVAGSLYAAEQRQGNGQADMPHCRRAELPVSVEALERVDSTAFAFAADQLSPGDRLRLSVAGDKDRFTGTYVIAADGNILLGGQLRVKAAGVTLPVLEQEIGQTLLQNRLVRAISGGVKLEQVELAGVALSVSGAVFEPGLVRVGERQPETRSVNLSNTVSGDRNTDRMLTTALRAAGGIRPDGEAGAIVLVRGQKYAVIDLSGALDGQLANDVQVASGDRVIVGSVGCLQGKMVRPSPVTTPGIRVYLSNLSRPAMHNAGSAIGKDATSLPYGTRFLQGIVSANCMGGSAMNAGRSAVLISRNPVNGQSVVISRSVEKLVRNADRDNFDPFLMPGDSIACYDSMAMNVRDVLSVVGETTAPYLLFKGTN